MENLKTPFNYATQTQKQRSPLNSSRNFEKNAYKLDYVLNKCPKMPFGMNFETIELTPSSGHQKSCGAMEKCVKLI